MSKKKVKSLLSAGPDNIGTTHPQFTLPSIITKKNSRGVRGNYPYCPTFTPALVKGWVTNKIMKTIKLFFTSHNTNNST